MTVADKKKAKLEELKAKALNKDIREINEILSRILEGNYTENDIKTIGEKILIIGVNGDSNSLKIGNNYINIGEGRDIHIGDCIYKGENAETIREILEKVLNDHNKEITEKIETLDKKIQEHLRQQKEEKERLRQQQEEKERLRQKQEEKERLRQKQKEKEHQGIFREDNDFVRVSVHSQPNSQNNSNHQSVGVKGL